MMWLTIFNDGDVHVWNIGMPADDARLQDVVMRARVTAGFPPGDGWIEGTDQRVNLAYGEPHPTLLARATQHQLSELDRVTPDALTTYRQACEVEHRQACVKVARESLAGLTPEERAQVIAELPPRPIGSIR